MSQQRCNSLSMLENATSARLRFRAAFETASSSGRPDSGLADLSIDINEGTLTHAHKCREQPLTLNLYPTHHMLLKSHKEQTKSHPCSAGLNQVHL